MPRRSMSLPLVVFLAAASACLNPGAAANETVSAIFAPPGLIVHKGPLALDRPVRPRGKRYRGPIIDTHGHVFDRRDRLDLDAVLAELKTAGVRRLLVLPTPNEGRYGNRDDNAAARRDFVRRAGRHGGRLCGSTYLTTWMNDAFRDGYSEDDLDKRLSRLERDITSGGCLGIGEIGPYHFEKREGQWAIEYPMNFEPMVRLARLAARLGIWLDLHNEPITPGGKSYEDQVFGGIAHLFKAAPGLRLILAHTGMTNPRNARALLTAYPGLMMNLKIAVPNRSLAWNNLGPIVNDDRELFEDWAKLMEDMPDRFMIGVDARFGIRRYSRGKYEKHIQNIRRLLGSLRPDAAEMIAWRNAERLWPAK